MAPCMLCVCCRVLVCQERFERGTSTVRQLNLSEIITSDLRRPIAETTVILSGSLGPAWSSALLWQGPDRQDAHRSGRVRGPSAQDASEWDRNSIRRGSGSCAKGREDGQERVKVPKDVNLFFADPTPTPSSYIPGFYQSGCVRSTLTPRFIAMFKVMVECTRNQRCS